MIESTQLGLPLEEAHDVVFVRRGRDHLRELIRAGAPVVGPSVIVVTNYHTHGVNLGNEKIDSLLQALEAGALSGFSAGSPGLIYPCRGGTAFKGTVDLELGVWHFLVLCRTGCPTAKRIEEAMLRAMWRNAAGIVRDIEKIYGFGLPPAVDMDGDVGAVAERLAQRSIDAAKRAGSDMTMPSQRYRPDYWIEVVNNYRKFQAMALEASRS